MYQDTYVYVVFLESAEESATEMVHAFGPEEARAAALSMVEQAGGTKWKVTWVSQPLLCRDYTAQELQGAVRPADLDWDTLLLFEIHQVVRGQLENISKMDREAIKDVLGEFLWKIGEMLDALDGVEHTEPCGCLGTRNKNSMTYKLRKLAGYSYP